MARDTEDADPKALSAILRAFLVRCGNPESRDMLAERLAGEGMTVSRLTLLCETMEGRGKEPAETAACIGQILKTRESWEEFVGDAEYAKAQRAARGGGKRGRHKPEVNLPNPGIEARRKHRELVAYVADRVNTDGKTPEWVADHVGESVESVQAMLDESRP